MSDIFLEDAVNVSREERISAYVFLVCAILCLAIVVYGGIRMAEKHWPAKSVRLGEVG